MSSSASVEGARRALSQFAAGVQLLKILDKRPAHESDVVENLVCTAARLAEEAASSGAAGGRRWLARPCDAHDKCRVVGQGCHMRDCCAPAMHAVVCGMRAGQLRAPQCTPKLTHCCKPRQHAIRSAAIKPHLPHGHPHSLHLPAMPPTPLLTLNPSSAQELLYCHRATAPELPFPAAARLIRLDSHSHLVTELHLATTLHAGLHGLAFCTDVFAADAVAAAVAQG